MSAGKNKSKKKAKPRSEKTEIDYKKLGHAIASALIEADSIRERQKEQELKEAQEKFRRILGEKECPKNAGKLKRKYYDVRNGLVSFWGFLWLKRKNAENLRAATTLAQLALALIFWLCELCLYFITSYFVWNTFRFGFTEPYFLWALNSLFFARFFRLARFEVDYLKDKEYLIALLSGVASFFAMLFALIGLFK